MSGAPPPAEGGAAAALAQLSRELGVPRELGEGWRLEELVALSPRAAELRLAGPSGRAFVLQASPRDDTRRAFARTARADLVHPPRTGTFREERALEQALSALVQVLRAADDARDIWSFAAEEVDTGAGPTQLTLSLRSPCWSRCVFCSPAVYGSPVEHELDALITSMERARRGGATRLDVSGLDPLSYGGIFLLLERATALGFEAVSISTTGHALADPRFVSRLLGVLPRRRSFKLPLHGDTAELHDGITGRAGSFARAVAALDNLQRLAPGADLAVTAVILRQNLAALPSVRDLVTRRGALFEAYMQFPRTPDRLESYRRTAVRFTEAVEVLHGARPPVPVLEAPRCVLRRHEDATGIPSASAIVPRSRPPLGLENLGKRHADAPGYLQATPSVACPSAERCSEAARCHRLVYRAYADVFGLSELA